MDNLKITDCSVEPKNTPAPWTMPTAPPTKLSFIEKPTPRPAKTVKTTQKIETTTEEEKDIVLGWFQRYSSTSTTSTVKTTTKETTTAPKAVVQTLPAGWGEKKVATPRTETSAETSTEAPVATAIVIEAATEPPEDDIEGIT